MRRALLLIIALVVPWQTHAANYVVQAGDTLGGIAARYHVSAAALAGVNGLSNVNLIQIGRVLFIPEHHTTQLYHVRWGDTLSGIAARFGTTTTQIRAMNPSLGAYLLAGESIRVCGGCAASTAPVATYRSQITPAGTSSAATYQVQAGDSLSGIASHYGVSTASILTANHLVDADHIIIGSWLTIPQATQPTYDSSTARALIVAYAQRYGINPALPLAIGWQESGFNQSMVSVTGAIGVMQVEPYTGSHISDLLGRPFNLWNEDDNIHAGVFWLGQLLAYYGWNEHLAIAAYYEGTRNIAQHGLFADTVQYVADVTALETRFAS